MDLKKLVFDIVNCTWQGKIKEISCDGLYVKYNGEEAVIGGSTLPAKARAYMLLAKGISEGKTEFEITQNASFDECGVMIDVSFGCPLKVSSIKKYLDYMAAFGMNLLMLYTEDMYEVEGYPHFGYMRGRYSLSELREVDDYATSLGIEVVPCVQTFGHLGKFLRYSAHSNIAENATVLLPGEEETYKFIEACIKTCRQAFRSKRIHIGCDETRGLGLGKTFARSGSCDRAGIFKIFNEHVARVTEICEKYDFHPMIWSDMYFSIAAPGKGTYATEIEVPQYAIDSMPDADMVFWDYYNEGNDFYRINIESHKKFNRKCIFAGGIWTWNGFVPNFRYTYDTVKPGLEECLRGGVKSVFGTAWAYSDINHMQALFCLAMYSEYCWRGLDCTREDINSVGEFVTKTSFELTEAISDFFCGLVGDFNIGKLVLFSDPLINLLCYDYDLPAYEKCFAHSLEVFEKYPDAPYIDYYKALFRAALSKVRLQQTLRTNYKAENRAWLSDFADVTVPKMVSEYKELFRLFDELWHNDQKTFGFEKTANDFAAAIARIEYAGKQVKRYLAGEISEIEELEPEPLRGKKQQFLSVARVMNTLA